VTRLLWTAIGAGHLPAASRHKLAVVALLYFVEGSPVSVLWEALPVYLRREGASLGMIGALRLIELPFSLKVLWSPLVQRHGDRRAWVTICMGLAALAVATLPLLDVGQPGLVLVLLLLLLTTASATQDIAIDSYTVALVDPPERGAANGIRASAYRVALVLIGNGMVTLAGWVPWPRLFLGAGVLLAGLGLAALAVPRLDPPPQARHQWIGPFVGWIATWRAIPLVGVVLTYRLGEFALGPMAKPFWVDRGRSLAEIGLVPGTLGIALSLVGALAGGAFIARYGVLAGVWILGAPQALSNLGYAAVAAGDLPWPALYATSMIDSFSSGLGTAAFLSLLMSVCDRDHATIQYAFLTSLFSLTGRLAGAVSGLGAEAWGYAGYFGFTFLLSLPAFALLPWIAPWIRDDRRAG
jgi:PAT family beta-lactamase induction signal transducer AmpG